MKKEKNRGIEKGKKSANIETAKKLLKMNLSIEQITEATGLNKEEVDDLKNS